MNSIEIKNKFDELVKKRDEAKTQIVQLQTKIDSANESINQIKSEWKEKYGVDSIEEVESLCKQLEEEITGILDKCEVYLKKVE